MNTNSTNSTNTSPVDLIDEEMWSDEHDEFSSTVGEEVIPVGTVHTLIKVARAHVPDAIQAEIKKRLNHGALSGITMTFEYTDQDGYYTFEQFDFPTASKQ